MTRDRPPRGGRGARPPRWRTLRAILAKLKSGEEGHYPHLNRHVEEKLMGMLTEKERRKVIALKTGPRDEDVVAATAALSAWADSVKHDDEAHNLEAENK